MLLVYVLGVPLLNYKFLRANHKKVQDIIEVLEEKTRFLHLRLLHMQGKRAENDTFQHTKCCGLVTVKKAPLLGESFDAETTTFRQSFIFLFLGYHTSLLSWWFCLALLPF